MAGDGAGPANTGLRVTPKLDIRIKAAGFRLEQDALNRWRATHEGGLVTVSLLRLPDTVAGGSKDMRVTHNPLIALCSQRGQNNVEMEPFSGRKNNAKHALFPAPRMFLITS
jgi:hypothetical protein